MAKKIAAVLLLLIFVFASQGGAAMTPAKKKLLYSRLSALTKKHKGKVGIYFVDLKTGLAAGINGDEAFPAASVAKVPVMAAAYRLKEAGAINFEQKITLKESDKLGGSGVLQWLKPGNSYTLWNLIRMMIVLSDNTATRLVINAIGIEKINDYLADIGMDETEITDSTMLAEPPAENVNLTTPKEMAQLTAKIQKARGFKKSSSAEMLKFMKNQRYRWGIWRGVPRGITVADKTGNLEKILNDVGVVYTAKGSYVLSVFTNGIKKQRTARKLINEISKTVYQVYTQ